MLVLLRLQAIALGAEGWGNQPSNRYQSYPSGALAVLEDVDYTAIAFAWSTDRVQCSPV